MAKSAGAVYIVDVAGVDPKMQAIAVFGPVLPAPGALCFSGNLQGEHQALLVPSGAQIGENRASLQLSKTGNAMFFRQFRAFGRPQRFLKKTGRRKAEQKCRRE